MARDLSFKISGGRVGILLIHRLCGTPTEMRFVANGLAKAGFTVHCPQLAGHCGSEEEATASTWQDWYRSAEDALFELKKECDVVIVGGLSTGAVLSLMLAARHPEIVKATTLYAPTLWLNGWMVPWYARLFRLIRHKWIANLFRFPHHDPHGIKDARIRDFIKRTPFAADGSAAGLLSTPGGLVLEHRWLVEKVTRLVETVTQPTLILHPREDDYAALSNAEYLQRNLKGSVEMVVLDDCYHIVTVDRQRHVVMQETSNFLGKIAARLGVGPAEAVPVRGIERPALAAA